MSDLSIFKKPNTDSKKTKNNFERMSRKLLRTTNKIMSISKHVNFKPLKKLAKIVSWEGSIRRTNNCINKGKGNAKCIIAEVSNQLIRRGTQFIGTTAMAGSVPLIATPTGITQIGGGVLIASGAKLIYDADDYGNKVAELIEGIDFKLDKINKMGKNIKEINTNIKNKWEKCEVVPKERVDIKTLFTKFHTNYFDGNAKNGYMNGVSQIRSESEPHIEIIPRLPDICIRSMDDMTFSAGMTVPL